MYLCITSDRDMDTVMFLSRGGVDVGDVDRDAETVDVETGCRMTEAQAAGLLTKLPNDKIASVAFYDLNVRPFRSAGVISTFQISVS